MRFGKGHAYGFEFAAIATEFAGAGGFGQLIENILGQEFGRGVGALELRQVVEILDNSAELMSP